VYQWLDRIAAVVDSKAIHDGEQPVCSATMTAPASPGHTEEDVYAALGVGCTPPQRRQDPAEIDAAAPVAAATEV
jgi:hypothetical protein